MNIILAVIISYILKIFPFIINIEKIINKYEYITIIFEYAICFIIGGIIYDVAFSNQTYFMLEKNFNIVYAIKISCLLLSFIVCKLTKSIIKSLLVSLIIFTILLRMFT